MFCYCIDTVMSMITPSCTQSEAKSEKHRAIKYTASGGRHRKVSSSTPSEPGARFLIKCSPDMVVLSEMDAKWAVSDAGDEFYGVETSIPRQGGVNCLSRGL